MTAAAGAPAGSKAAAPATTESAAPAGFLGGINAKYLIDKATEPVVFLTLVVVLLATVFRKASKTFVKWLGETFQEVKFGDITVKFQELEEKVAVAATTAETALAKAEDLAVQRAEVDALIARFDPAASGQDLDVLATRAKSAASAVSDLTGFIADLKPGSDESKVFGAAIVARQQPRPAFLGPLAAQISYLAAGNLRGFRLKTAYRLVMAIETVLRTDNRLKTRLVDPAAREQTRVALSALAATKRAKDDDAAAGEKGIGARIARALRLVEAP